MDLRGLDPRRFADACWRIEASTASASRSAETSTGTAGGMPIALILAVRPSSDRTSTVASDDRTYPTNAAIEVATPVIACTGVGSSWM
jgi:hypothetical protein